ncbi:SDR family NAD(P)-dependent oxidoreductase [Marinomonas epiphytica]
MVNYQLVIGANSLIAQALIQQFLTDKSVVVIAISRHPIPIKHDRVKWIPCNYQEQEIEAVCETLESYRGHFHGAFICNGILEQPEKKLEDINSDHFIQTIQANTLTPLVWISRLIKLLAGRKMCFLVVFSARIGSISDNKLGGWYSYRASKAALNMLLKTASIEYARRAQNVKLIAFHPGTTDTPLSKPFQSSIPKNALFNPSFVAEQLIALLRKTKLDKQISFFDWEHKKINW